MKFISFFLGIFSLILNQNIWADDFQCTSPEMIHKAAVDLDVDEASITLLSIMAGPLSPTGGFFPHSYIKKHAPNYSDYFSNKSISATLYNYRIDCFYGTSSNPTISRGILGIMATNNIHPIIPLTDSSGNSVFTKFEGFFKSSDDVWFAGTAYDIKAPFASFISIPVAYELEN